MDSSGKQLFPSACLSIEQYRDLLLRQHLCLRFEQQHALALRDDAGESGINRRPTVGEA
ncbi:hypothetical protein D3C77_395970 [compost metagenome]